MKKLPIQKLPQKIKIGAQYFRLELDPNLEDSGRYLPEEEIIKVNPRAALPDFLESILHEIQHPFTLLFMPNMPKVIRGRKHIEEMISEVASRSYVLFAMDNTELAQKILDAIKDYKKRNERRK